MSEDRAQSFEHRRGDRGAYQRYLDGMDASMRQKVALVAAHLRAQGQVADMGMGSGTGSHALAALYPALDVVGVDLDPTMVELAAERYRLDNLSFRQGDIAKRVFEDNSLEAIIDSSVLHHVTSFNGYDAQQAASAIAVQAQQLRQHGVVIVRDFLAPEEQIVYLDLPTNDGEGEEPATCSTSQLFERFASDARLLSSEPGFSYEAVGEAGDLALRPGWKRFKVGLRPATEFILRKDYRRDYLKEAKEEYCYFTQSEFETVFADLGLRVLASTPLRNPWIVNHRYRDKLMLWSLDGEALEFPATNYIIVGEKVPAGQGVRFVEAERAEPLDFLRLEHHRNTSSGQVFDLVRRPNATLDILPWFELQGDHFVLARASSPRPILRAKCRQEAALDGASAAGYVTEPLVVVQGDRPIGSTVEEALQKDAGIHASQIRGMSPGSRYYPSPGGIEEQVTSSLVEIEPTFVSEPQSNRSGFGTAGRVMAIEAQQLLRSAQVGGLLDARVELNVYELLLQRKQPVGPWIGEALDLPVGSAPKASVELSTLQKRPHRRVFESVSPEHGRDFLQLECAHFHELDRSGKVQHKAALEYVVPRSLSHNSIATALLRRDEDTIWIALDDDDLPAAQSFTGNSELLVAPAWRCPHPSRLSLRRSLGPAPACYPSMAWSAANAGNSEVAIIRLWASHPRWSMLSLLR